MDKAKISVVVITYNQQDCITKALDSLTCQKDWIYEIIVSDDCSKDKTWQVVNEYAERFPDLVKPYRNETNLGIYGNMLAGYKRATGNVIATLSGDDEFMPDCCEKAVKYLEEQDVLDKVFHLYFNRRRHFIDNRPDYTFRNNLVTSPRKLSYTLRSFTCEPTFFSPKFLVRCVPPLDLGICGDMYWSIQRIVFSDVILYIDATSVKYNAGIGVSVRESMKKFRDSEIKVFNRILNNNELSLTKKDKKYILYRLLCTESYYTPSWRYLLLTTHAFIKSVDLTLGFCYQGIINHIKYIYRYILYIKSDCQLK